MMNTLTPLTSVQCRRCGNPGCDLQLLGCGCVLHAMCTPLSLVLAPQPPRPSDYVTQEQQEQDLGIPPPVTSKLIPCPICRSGQAVTGIRLFPMNFDDLERAIELRKLAASVKEEQQEQQQHAGDKRSRDSSSDDPPATKSAFAEIQAEAAYLLHTSHASMGGSRQESHHFHRTGRWTNEETAFCDHLVHAFEQSLLPLPRGVKLNDFLGDMLLCKSSRLTKKMKNAKLSTRSYALKSPVLDGISGQVEHLSSATSTLSNLQQLFLNSVISEPTQLELRFNLTKLWRVHFSNLCLQVGYDLLDARDWLASLEEMESRATQVEQNLRKARRRRLSQALRTDVGGDGVEGVFVAGIPARDAPTMQPPAVSSSSSLTTTTSVMQKKLEAPAVKVEPGASEPSRGLAEISISGSEKTAEEEDDDAFLAALELTVGDMSGRARLFSEDYFLALEALGDPTAMIPSAKETPAPCLGDCGSFLDKVVLFMEKRDVPFQHVDVWVPSLVGADGKSAAPQNGEAGSLRLFHAGHATRADLNPVLSAQLNEYGVYSTHFSFAPGVGLPGRVYATGEATWERGIHNADPTIFERAGGAKVYGMRTALGIPLEAPEIGRIVVIMYGSVELDEDVVMKEMIRSEITKWVPQPKWKLVIELGTSSAEEREAAAASVDTNAIQTNMVHVSHEKRQVAELAPIRTQLVHFSHEKPLDTKQPAKSVVKTESLPESSMPMATHADNSSLVASREDDVEQQIASLLGDHMPVDDGQSSSQENMSLLHNFMSLRLLLLRSRDRRSAQDQEFLDVIHKSFCGYTKENKRSGAELARLLAKDWMYLKQAAAPTMHQSHVMSATMTSMTTGGMPTRMPSTVYSLPMSMSSSSLSNKQVSFSSMDPADLQGPNDSTIPPRSRSVSASSDSSAYLIPEV